MVTCEPELRPELFTHLPSRQANFGTRLLILTAIDANLKLKQTQIVVSPTPAISSKLGQGNMVGGNPVCFSWSPPVCIL